MSNGTPGVELPTHQDLPFSVPGSQGHPRVVLWFPSTRTLPVLSSVLAEIWDLSFSGSGKRRIWDNAVTEFLFPSPAVLCLLGASSVFLFKF